MRIGIIVHGRFHSFDLARALLAQGHDVVVFTNYPKHIAHKFGLPRERVISYTRHALLARAGAKLFGSHFCEAWMHQMFGRWAAASIHLNEPFDAIHGFSGIAEEFLQRSRKSQCIYSVVRGSAHIEVQARLLLEEERRADVPIDRPTDWMRQRELREYAAADMIVTLSSFARQSFLDQGIAAEKVVLVPLGSDLKRFRSSAQVIEERCQRIMSRERLRVLTVGTFSYRKGAIDLVAMAGTLRKKFDFRFVGDTPAETRNLKLRANWHITPRQPQFQLPRFYDTADVFVFPTIEDGYAVVLAQAQASGLPILATTNCAAPDIIEPGKNGWVLPIRSPQAFIERLEWCDTHRNELAAMVKYGYEQFKGRDWSMVAADLISSYRRWGIAH